MVKRCPGSQGHVCQISLQCYLIFKRLLSAYHNVDLSIFFNINKYEFDFLAENHYICDISTQDSTCILANKLLVYQHAVNQPRSFCTMNT